MGLSLRGDLGSNLRLVAWKFGWALDISIRRYGTLALNDVLNQGK